MSFRSKLGETGKLISHFEDGVTLLLMLGLVFLIFGTVITRYVLEITVPQLEELARYSLLWLVFIASSVAIRQRAHIRIEALPLMIKKKQAERLIYALEIVGLVAACFFAYLLFDWILDAWGLPTRSPFLKFRMAWVQTAIFPIVLLWIGHHIAIIIRESRTLFGKKRG